MSTGIQTSINQNTLALVASTAVLKNTFQEGFDSINNTLDLGFAGVNESIGMMSASMSAGFSSLSASIDYWEERICDKLDEIHDIVNNPLLTASRELYRRAEKNVSKKFYEEAVEDLISAIEKNKTDYISWGLLGKVYLFGVSEFSNTINVPKAIEALTNACKYVTPDIDEAEEASKIASEFYFYLGFANYVLANENRLEGKTNESQDCLEASIKANAKSYALSDSMLEARYNKSRAHSLLGQKTEALDCIKKSIQADALYSIKALNDDDFASIKSDIENIITELRDELYADMNQKISYILENYCFYNSNYAQSKKKMLEKAQSLTPSTPYLDLVIEYSEIKTFYNTLLSGNIPFDLEAAKLIITCKGKHICVHTNFSTKLYKGCIIDVTSSEDHSSLKEMWGLEKSEEEGNSNDPVFYAYSFKPIEFGKGKIILKCIHLPENEIKKSTLSDIAIIKNCDEPKLDSVGDAYTWQIDDNTKFEYEVLETEFHHYDYECLEDGYEPSKCQLSVKQPSIIERSKIKELEEKTAKAKEEDEKAEEIKRQEQATTAAKEYRNKKISKKYKITYIIGIILFVPLAVLGYFLLKKTGILIFALLDISFISYFVAKSLFCDIGADYRGKQSFLLSWGLYQHKNFVFLISSALFLCILGAKTGSLISHGFLPAFLGFFAGLVIYSVIMIVLRVLSRNYR